MIDSAHSAASKRAAVRPGRDALRFELLTPTLLEYVTARLLRPDYPVRYAGMRLSRWRERSDYSVSVVCGLAGALSPGLQPGDVVIPQSVATLGGAARDCDVHVIESLRSAATSLGFRVVSGPMLTSPEMVTGPDREYWATQGFIAADMETGLLPEHLRIGAVRVILDTPDTSISSQWVKPARAIRSRSAWGELVWLARVGPTLALRASRIADLGLRQFRSYSAS